MKNRDGSSYLSQRFPCIRLHTARYCQSTWVISWGWRYWVNRWVWACLTWWFRVLATTETKSPHRSSTPQLRHFVPLSPRFIRFLTHPGERNFLQIRCSSNVVRFCNQLWGRQSKTVRKQERESGTSSSPGPKRLSSASASLPVWPNCCSIHANIRSKCRCLGRKNRKHVLVPLRYTEKWAGVFLKSERVGIYGSDWRPTISKA